MIKSPPRFFLPELLATFFYTYYTQTIALHGWDLFFGAFSTGFVVYCLIVINNTSAVVHFNPAVTVAFWIAKNGINYIEMFWYFGAQLVGGLLGTMFTYTITAADPKYTNFTEIAGTYKLDQRTGDEYQTWQYILAILSTEIVGTFVLCLAATVCVYNKMFKDPSGAMMIGMTVFLGISAGGSLGAGCLNPLRSAMPWMLMPSKIMQNWVFMIGPMLGGALAGVFFNIHFFGFCAEKSECEKSECEKSHDDEEKQDLNSK